MTSSYETLEMNMAHVHDHSYNGKPAEIYKLNNTSLPVYIATNGTSNTSRKKKGDAFSFSDLAYNLVNLRSYGTQIRAVRQISTPVIRHVTTL